MSQDPSVTQVTNSGIDHIEHFNPFPDGNTVSVSLSSLVQSEFSVLLSDLQNEFVCLCVFVRDPQSQQASLRLNPLSCSRQWSPVHRWATHTNARNMTSETLTEACPSAQATAAAAQANLLRQQEELERKAAELDRREQELHNRGATTTGDTQTHTFYTPAVK